MEYNVIQKDNSKNLIMNSHSQNQMTSVSSSGKFLKLQDLERNMDPISYFDMDYRLIWNSNLSDYFYYEFRRWSIEAAKATVFT